MGITSKTMQHKSSKSGHPILFLILEEMFNFLTIKYDVSCEFIWALLCLGDPLEKEMATHSSMLA